MADDLLSFVQALDAADGQDTLAQDLYGTTKRTKKTLKPLVPAPTTALSLDDLDSSTIITVKQPKSKKLSIPLPPTLQRRVEQQVAYEETKQDMGKWSGVVRETRERDTLSFPQHPVTVPVQPTMNILGFAPISDFERQYLSMIANSGGNICTDQESSHTLDAAFPLQPGALERDVEAAQNRAKLRSDAFFRDRKAAHQAKIKSKKYRKLVARERSKQTIKTVGQVLDLEQSEQRKSEERKRRAMERARERLTLKTRKASKWASDMLIHKHSNDPQSRLQVMEQVLAKNQLRKEILGHHSEGEESDSESEGEGSESESEEEELMRDITGDVSESEEPVVGRVSFKPQQQQREIVRENDRFHNSDHDSKSDGEPVEEPQLKKNKTELLISRLKERLAKPQKDLAVLNSQQQVEPSAEFEELKRAESTAEAPREQDLTLAGWGSWTGPNASSNSTIRRTTVTKSIPGIDQSKRRDAKLQHVIITEKRANTGNLQTDKVPFPFTSAAEYERAVAVPLGPEWNTVRAFGKKTRPRVQVQAGAIIDPQRVKSTNSVVLE